MSTPLTPPPMTPEQILDTWIASPPRPMLEQEIVLFAEFIVRDRDLQWQARVAELDQSPAPQPPGDAQQGVVCEPQRAVTSDGWTDWICPKPVGYLMQCCDCGLVHEVDSRVAHYKPRPSEEYSVVDDPDMQAQWRMRRRDDLAATAQASEPSAKWSIGDLAGAVDAANRDLHETIASLCEQIRYMVGIAERGTGAKCPDSERPEVFLLNYVKALEAAPARAVEPLTQQEIGDIASLFYAKWRGHESFAHAVIAAFCKKNGITTTPAAKEQ